ncbi:MAG: hypothetical protein AAF620_06630 [Bacteroidota bacterium]
MLEQLGHSNSDSLKYLIRDIFVVDRLEQIVFSTMSGFDSNTYWVELMGVKIIMVPNHKKNPIDSEGNIDWNKVNRIKIINIEVND